MDTLFAPLDAWMNAHRVFTALLIPICWVLFVAWIRLIVEPRKRLEEQLRISEILRMVEAEMAAGRLQFADAVPILNAVLPPGDGGETR